ncbi:MAG: AAA family ATPase [Lacisediminihabitans sp.]
MDFARYPLRFVGEDPLAPMSRDSWPATLAPVRQLLTDGLDLGPATVFVGENGAGKSTVVEGIALAYGLSAEGGSTGARHTTRASESPLGDHLQLQRNIGSVKGGFFLRAETAHGLFSYLEKHQGFRPEPVFHELSHGESFLELVADRSKYPGLWVLDEPESALSFSGCLSLLVLLKEILASGKSQVILSTHSPILATLPGAVIYEIGDWGLRPRDWNELTLVDSWRRFLAAPEGYLRHL